MNSPLAFLETDHTTGWSVARHPHKALNHLDFLRRQEQIVGLLSQDGLSDHERETLFRDYLKVRHLEFHPCDVCNLACRACTYGHDVLDIPQVNYPFAELGRLAEFEPRSMVIVGGGEPVLYRDHQHRFPHLVAELDRLMPQVRIGLVTNGTYKPAGDWPDRMAWIRISIDAATPETFETFRGRPLFGKVLDNFLAYLSHSTAYVGVGFLFSRANIQEYVPFAELIYGLVQRQQPQALGRINIQYRPLRHDPPYHGDGDYVTPADIESVMLQIVGLARTSPEMETFLREQTNVTAILRGNPHQPRPFSRCLYSEIFKIVRANGDLRPCCVAALEPELHLGNIIHSPTSELAAASLDIAAAHSPYCNPTDCRYSHMSELLQLGLDGSLAPSTAPAVVADPMF